MGNTETKLKIEHLFDPEKAPPKQNETFHIRMCTPDLARGEIIIKISNDSLIVTKALPTESENVITWTPQSHMRDFEVLKAFTKDEKKIARGQGIGVIIVEPCSSYCKFIWDKDDPTKIEVAVYAKFVRNQNSKEVVSADLSLGYNVLLIRSKTDYEDLCEPHDERDKRETAIFIHGLESMNKYAPKRRTSTVNDRSNDNDGNDDNDPKRKHSTKKPKVDGD